MNTVIDMLQELLPSDLQLLCTFHSVCSINDLAQVLYTGARMPEEQDLIPSIVAGDMVKVRKLIEGGVNPTIGLEIAIDTLQYDIANYLILAGADTTDVLHAAIRNNNTTVLQFLLDNGTSINTAIGYTVGHGSSNVLKYLLNHGGNINTALVDAVSGKYTTVVKYLLDKGADPNTRLPTGESLVYMSSYINALDITQLLIENGADLTVDLDTQGETPLTYALRFNKKPLTLLILKNPTGASTVDRKDSYDNTPLIYALRNKWYDVVDILLNMNVDINIVDSNNKTPLIYAFEAKDYELVKRLISAGANPNASFANGDTPLYLALISKHDDIARMLIDNGADVDLALIKLIMNADLERVVYFLKNGANLNSVTYGSPLVIATTYNRPEVVGQLIKLGATVGFEDALKIAIDNEYTDILHELVYSGLPIDSDNLELISEVLEPHPCSEYTLPQLQTAALAAGVEVSNILGIPKRFSELCYDTTNAVPLKSFFKGYTFGENFTAIAQRESSRDIALLMKNRSRFLQLNNAHTNPSKVWIRLVEDYLCQNRCMAFKYCDIIYGYTHHGDTYINNILSGKIKDDGKMSELFKKYEDSHDKQHIFQKFIDYMTKKHYNVGYINGILEIYKNITYIILSAPVTKEYITVYRGESSDYPGNAMINDEHTGNIFINNRLISTSLSLDVATSEFALGNRLLRILIPPESHALIVGDCSKFINEEEILLPPKCVFLVLNTTLPTSFNDMKVYDLLLLRTPIMEIEPMCGYKLLKENPTF